jgi:hypothetical protein
MAENSDRRIVEPGWGSIGLEFQRNYRRECPQIFEGNHYMSVDRYIARTGLAAQTS